MSTKQEKKIRYLQNKISKTKEYLQKLPKGTLISAVNGKSYKWYERVNGERRYIPKGRRAYAEKLACRKYLEYVLQEDIRELAWLQKHAGIQQMTKKSEVLLMNPRYKELLQPFFSSETEKLAAWEKEEYPQNPYCPENLIHKTPAGYLVRSKSEVMISMMLTQNHISHRYECGMELNGSMTYPDFTIIHPRTNQVLYWEHFGMMDDSEYSTKAVKKIGNYIRGGIIPYIHVIMTFETIEEPLSFDRIQTMIDDYLS